MASQNSVEKSNQTELLSCVRCSKLSTLQCPKCLELKQHKSNAAFCSQECFKEMWPEHKILHKFPPPSALQEAKLVDEGKREQADDEKIAAAALSEGWLYPLKKGQSRTFKMPEYEWTGDLRPFPISARRHIPDSIPRPDWSKTGRPVDEPNSQWQHSVEIKSADQIAKLRRCCKIARGALDAAARAIAPGVTADEIDGVVHDFTIAAGGYPSPLNYYSFPKSCCTSVNEVVCHGIPDARPLRDGDILNVDVSVYIDGVHGDLNETYFVGTPSPDSLHLVKSTWECLEKSIEMVKPGARFRDIGEVISRHASMAGLAVVKTYCGHGIGEHFHCAPNIPHYARNKAVGIMKAGQVFTIEPMINQGTWRDRMWPDGWTAVTSDGKKSAQFEHTLLVTETGCEVLTARLPTSPPMFSWTSP